MENSNAEGGGAFPAPILSTVRTAFGTGLRDLYISLHFGLDAFSGLNAYSDHIRVKGLQWTVLATQLRHTLTM